MAQADVQTFVKSSVAPRIKGLTLTKNNFSKFSGINCQITYAISVMVELQLTLAVNADAHADGGEGLVGRY